MGILNLEVNNQVHPWVCNKAGLLLFSNFMWVPSVQWDITPIKKLQERKKKSLFIKQVSQENCVRLTIVLLYYHEQLLGLLEHCRQNKTWNYNNDCSVCYIFHVEFGNDKKKRPKKKETKVITILTQNIFLWDLTDYRTRKSFRYLFCNQNICPWRYILYLFGIVYFD